MTSAKSHKSKKAGSGRPRSNSRRADAPPGQPELIPGTDLVPSPSSGAPADDLPPPSIAVAPEEGDPKKQFWYRKPDSKIRKKVEKILVMKAAGHKTSAIAKRLGTTEGTIRQDLYIAKRNGWLDDDGEPIDLEAELALNVDRKIVRNINASLDGQMTNWQTHEMTIAAAKGRGVFRNHERTDGGQAQAMPVVAIQVIRPEGMNISIGDIPEDQMGGVPAYLEGEVDPAVAELQEGGPDVDGAVAGRTGEGAGEA